MHHIAHVKRVKYISDKVAAAMFDTWVKVRNDGGYKAVAKQHQLTVTRVKRIAERDHWDDRTAEIVAKAQAAQDAEITQQERRNLDLVRDVKLRTAERLLAMFEANPTYTPSIRILMELVRLEEDLVGVKPGQSAEPHNVFNTMTQILNQLPDETKNELQDIFGKVGSSRF